MATSISQLKATAAELAVKTPANGLLIWDETNRRWVGGDGITPGGVPMSKASDIVGLMQGYPVTPGGRLSLTAATPVPTADVASSNTLYYIAYGSVFTPVYDGTKFTVIQIPDTLQLALDAASAHPGYHQSGKNFDVFAIADGSTGNIKIGTGPSWTAGATAGSDTARGIGAGSSEIESYKGLLVNRNSITLRVGANAGDTVVVPARQATYIGSIRTTADGIATDTARQRFVFNPWNGVKRMLRALNPSADYNYNGGTYIILANNVLNRIEMLFGLSGVEVNAMASCLVIGSTGTPNTAFLRIGMDSVTLPSPDGFGDTKLITNTAYSTFWAQYEGVPGLGYHFLNPIIKGSTVDTETWKGSTVDQPAGISGSAVL